MYIRQKFKVIDLLNRNPDDLSRRKVLPILIEWCCPHAAGGVVLIWYFSLRTGKMKFDLV